MQNYVELQTIFLAVYPYIETNRVSCHSIHRQCKDTQYNGEPEQDKALPEFKRQDFEQSKSKGKLRRDGETHSSKNHGREMNDNDSVGLLVQVKDVVMRVVEGVGNIVQYIIIREH